MGYAARIACHNDTSKLMSYIIQQMFILLPPVLFAASIYMVLGRIITALRGDQYSPIRPSRLTKTFLAGDIISFYIQGGGGGLTAAGARSTGTGPNLALIGQWVVVGGLILQIIIFGLFCLTAVKFHKRYQRAVLAPAWPEWKSMMHMLYFVSGLIMVRNLFRTIEFVTGTDGYLQGHEWTLYVFDTILMFLVLIVFFFFHPSRIPGLTKEDQYHMRTTSAEEGLHPSASFQNTHQLQEQQIHPKY